MNLKSQRCLSSFERRQAQHARVRFAFACLALLQCQAVMADGGKQPEGEIIVAARSEAGQPRWLGLINLGEETGDSRRVVHLPISTEGTLENLPAGQFIIDHLDFSETIAGDERTIRLGKGPTFTVRAGSIRYFGDLLLQGPEVRLIIDWSTIDALCRSHPERFLDTPLVTGLNPHALRTVTDACDAVNL